MSDIISTSLQTHIQKTLVQGLKAFFTSYPQYAFSESFAQTKILITAEYPAKMLKYPHVVVGSITGDPLVRTIGRQVHEVIRGTRIINGLTITNAVCGVSIGGGHYVSVPILIAALTTAERRLLKDIVSVFLNALYKDYLAQNGMHISSISLAGGREVAIGNQYVYWDELAIKFYTEWREVMYDLPLISKAQIDGITYY